MNKSELLSLRYELESMTIDFWHEVDIKGGSDAPAFYTDDAVFQSSVREYRGRTAIQDFYSRRRERGHRVSLHLVNNFRIEVDSDTQVRGQYVLSLFAADGQPVLPSRPAIMLALVEELFVKQADGSWLYASRRVHPQFRDNTPTTG
ncbi:MAG: nuclear transport factor 2 family protein [Polaromonas sp.]|nr:nuclear transport factor 2 family protein [Polaromonas sp.]